MIIYIRCTACKFKQKIEGKSFGCPVCPKCGGIKVDMNIGGKPSWWTEEDEKNAGK